MLAATHLRPPASATLQRRLCRFLSGDWCALIEELTRRPSFQRRSQPRVLRAAAASAAAARLPLPGLPPQIAAAAGRRPAGHHARTPQPLSAAASDDDGTADLHADMAKALRKSAAPPPAALTPIICSVPTRLLGELSCMRSRARASRPKPAVHAPLLTQQAWPPSAPSSDEHPLRSLVLPTAGPSPRRPPPPSSYVLR